MSKIINGGGEPRFVIKDRNNHFIKQFDLPYTNIEGLIEGYEPVFKQHTLASEEKVSFDFKGYEINFTIDYNNFVTRDVLMNIKEIESFLENFNDYRVYLMPRIDVLRRTFEVVMPREKSYSLGLLLGSYNAPGHNGVVLKVVTKHPVEKLWLNPDNLTTRLPFFLK